MNLLEVAGAFSLGLAVIFLIRLWRADAHTFEEKVFVSITAAVVGAGLLLFIGSVTSATNAWPTEFWFYPAGLAVGLSVSSVLWRQSGETDEQFNFKNVVAGLMVAGILLLVFSHDLPTKGLAEIGKSLGEAIFIASVLAATVDLYVKQRTYREISVDIFKFLIGYGLPDEFKNRIRELVTNSDLIRKECTIIWTLDPVEGEPDAIKLAYNVTYKLSNISDRAVPHQFRTSQGVNDPVETKVLRLWGRTPSRDTSYDMTGEELVAEPPDETGKRWIRGKPFDVPADSEKHGLEYVVGAEYESRLYGRQFDYHVFAYPTLGASVIVKHPGDFKVYLSPPLSRPSEPHRGRSESMWKYNRLFFTHDAIFVRWSRAGTPQADVAGKALKTNDISETKDVALTGPAKVE